MNDRSESAADTPDWGVEEQFLANLMRQEPSERKPDCLEPEQLAMLLERGDRTPNAAALRRHLGGCAFCSREFAAASEALSLFRAADAESASQSVDSRPVAAAPAVPWWRTAWSSLFSPSLALGGAAAALLVAYVGMIRPQQAQIESLRSRSRGQTSPAPDAALAANEVKRLTQENARLTEEALGLRASQQQTEARIQQLAAETNRLGGVAEQLRKQMAAAPPQSSTPPAGDVLSGWRQKGLRGLQATGGSPPVTNYAGSSGPKPIAVEEPPRGSSTAALRPFFRWKPLADQDARYIVSIAQDRKVIDTSAPMKEAQWQPARSLKSGTYLWQVRAVKAGAQPTDAEPEGETIAISDQTPFRRIEAGPLRTELLTLAVRYATLRQWQQAEEAANRVLEMAPDDADAKRLLQQIAEERAAAQKPR